MNNTTNNSPRTPEISPTPFPSPSFLSLFSTEEKNKYRTLQRNDSKNPNQSKKTDIKHLTLPPPLSTDKDDKQKIDPSNIEIIHEILERVDRLHENGIDGAHKILTNIILESKTLPLLLEQYNKDSEKRRIQKQGIELKNAQFKRQMTDALNSKKVCLDNYRRNCCIICGETDVDEYFEGFDVYTCCVDKSECHQMLRTIFPELPHKQCGCDNI